MKILPIIVLVTAGHLFAVAYASDLEPCQVDGKPDIEVVKAACERLLVDPEVTDNVTQVGQVYLQLIKIAYQQQEFARGEELLLLLKTEYPQFLVESMHEYQWFYEMGKMKIRSNDNKAAIQNFQQAFEIARALDLPEKSAFSLNALGLSYKKDQQHQKSLAAYLQSFRYKEQLGDTESMANTLMNIGDVYYFLEEYDNALNTYVKARKNYVLAESTLDAFGWQNLAHCLENIGVMHYRLQQYDDSIDAMREALNTIETEAPNTNKTTAYTYLGMSHQAESKRPQALEYYQMALAEDIQHSNSNTLLRYHLANFYWQQQNAELAWQYLEAGLQMAPDNEQYIHILPDLYLLKSQIQRQQGALEAAMQNQSTYYDLKEKLLTQKFNQSTQNMLHRIEIEHSQYEVQLLEKDNQYKAISINRQYWIILSISLLGLMAALFVWRQFKLRSREKQQLLAEIADHRHKLSRLEGSKHQLKDIYADRSEGVLCTDSGGSVVFYNAPFARLFNLRETSADGLKLSDVIPALATVVNQLPVDANDMPMRTRIEDFHIKTDTLDTAVNIKVDAIHLLDDYSILLIDSSEAGDHTNDTQDVLTVVEEIMQSPDLKRQLLPLLKEQLGHATVEHNAVEPFRASLVELMQTCVTVWHAHTKTNRIELADVSGIWRVSIDDGRLRTRAMDRYLHIKNLPKNPRWRQVVKTAHFILSEHELSLQNRKQLSTVLERFLEGMKTDWSA